jgi:iron(III) transport system ATP-binding protein
MIRFETVRVDFGTFTAIPSLSLEVAEGEFFTLLGPSGCGKTTALRSLAGFVRPSSGSIHIDGRDVTALASDKRGVGMVFQNYALFPSMSVRENIAFGLKVRRIGRSERERLVEDIARRVDLTEQQLGKNVAELSGGQQQRVAIARALVLKPKILLLDEPLSNLDAKLRHQLRGELKDLQSELGITTVYVTHDQDEALTMSDRIAVFNAGRVEQVGTPQDVYERSASEFVCTFIGDSSVIGPDLVQRIASSSPDSLEAGSRSYIRVEKPSLVKGHRPEAGHGTQDGEVLLDGVVTGSSYHGLHTRYTVRTHGSDVKVLVKETGRGAPEVGDAVVLGIHPRHVLQYGGRA